MKITTKTLGEFRFLSNLKTSRDGQYVYYTASKADFDDNDYKSHIYRTDPETKETVQLTAGTSESAFEELENGDLLFPAKREKENENTCFYRLPKNGGEALKEFEIEYPVTFFKEIKKDVYLLGIKFDRVKELDKMKYEGKDKPKDFDDYEVFTEIPYWSNGEGFTSGVRNRLALYKKGERPEFISDDISSYYGVRFNEDKTKFVAIRSRYTGKMPLTNEIIEYDLQTGTKEILSKDLSHSFADYLDGGIIFFATDMKQLGINQNNSVYYIDGGKTTKIYDEISNWNSVGTDLRYGGSVTERVHGDKLYFVGTDEYRSVLYSIDKKGHLETVRDENTSIDGLDFSGESLYTVEITADRAQEIYRNGERITEWNDLDLDLATTKTVEFENDGLRFRGYVKYPLDYKKGKKYPVILSVHGGPKTVFGDILQHETELFAAKGYFVIYTNPRGSDGRGDEFSDIRGKYGEVDYEDLMAFTDYCLEHFDDMDDDNLFMTGGSYGGFMANWIVGHTDRFSAVCSQRSISNWVSMYGASDIGYYFANDQNADATPWDRPDVLWKHSPLKYADRVKTPVIFIHSDEDYRCWMAEGLQMFTALKVHGVEAKLVLFHGENHELSRSGKPLHRERRLKEMISFFDDHLTIRKE